MKTQRKTKNLGLNTSKTQDSSFQEIEKMGATSRCSDSKHEGERMLPVRMFYLNGSKVQGACITCQKNYRMNRIKRCREKFQDKTKEEIDEMYRTTYGETKTCSNCKISKIPSDFPVSITIECGLHNHCKKCSSGNSQGNGGLRDYIFMPDKDGIKYKKKSACETCGGVDKLAVDHILPIAKGGTDCIINKQTLCVHCNSKKNDTLEDGVKPEYLSERYRDVDLDFTDTISLSRILSKKVLDFRESNLVDAELEEIRTSVTEYKKKHNLGDNLDRIVGKIAILFDKV